MFKKTVTYRDFNDVERTEEYFFHLSTTEVLKLEKNKDGSLSEQLEKIQRDEDEAAMLDMITKLVLLAYGEKSEDGRRFVKSDKLVEEFTETEAYSQIFLDIMTNENELIDFITGILPKEMSQEVQKAMKEQEKLVPMSSSELID